MAESPPDFRNDPAVRTIGERNPSIKPTKPKEYDGNRDPMVIEAWIRSVNSFAALTHATNLKLFHFLSTAFIGSAAVWFNFVFGSPKKWAPYTWAMVKSGLRSHFTETNKDRKLRDQWAQCRQTTTVTEYVSRLQTLVLLLKIGDNDAVLDKFIRGLKPRTKIEVELKDPKDLEEAIRLADRYDTIVYQKASNSSYDPWAQSITRPRGQPKQEEDTRGEPMQLDALNPKRKSEPKKKAPQSSSPASGLVKLTPEERDRLHESGACFKCRKIGHMAKDCPTRTTKNSKSQ